MYVSVPSKYKNTLKSSSYPARLDFRLWNIYHIFLKIRFLWHLFSKRNCNEYITLNKNTKVHAISSICKIAKNNVSDAFPWKYLCCSVVYRVDSHNELDNIYEFLYHFYFLFYVLQVLFWRRIYMTCIIISFQLVTHKKRS